MADIYVRPYDSGGKKTPRGLLLFALIAFLCGGIAWWVLSRRSSEEVGPETVEEVTTAASDAPVVSGGDVAKVAVQTVARPAPLRTSKPTAVPVSTPAKQVVQINVERLFSRAQSLVSAGKLSEASELLDEVIDTASDMSLRNNALRVQGRVNVDLFLSEAPSPLKKSYVIQPGDSLDRIAKRNQTTVELIRTMNKIDGNLIYPGARLRLPAAPFVLHVQKSSCTMELVMNGKRFKRYFVGLGRYGKTPLGTFTTVVHQANPDWSPPSGGVVPFGDPRNVLGTRWMSIQDEARPEIKGFGIHGTVDRESIGTEASNGCIRMLNEDVEEVFLLIPRGTKVVINE